MIDILKKIIIDLKLGIEPIVDIMLGNKTMIFRISIPNSKLMMIKLSDIKINEMFFEKIVYNPISNDLSEYDQFLIHYIVYDD